MKGVDLMQGIKVSFDKNSVNKIKTEFESLINELQKKANVDINLNKINEQIKNIENTIKNTSKKLKLFDENQLKQDNVKVFQSIDEIRKAYENLGEVNFSSIFKDANEEINGMVLQLKKADGIISNIKFDKINIAGKGDNLSSAFIVGSIKDVDKTADIAEKQAQKIQSINKKITEQQEAELLKQKNDREDYINWWIEQDNKLTQAMANGNEKSILESRKQLNDEAIKQAKAINKSLEDEYQIKLNEQKRISNLGELKTVVSPDLINKSNDEIKQYIQSLYGLDGKIVSFKKSTDGANNSIVKMTVNTKNSKNEIRQENLVLDQTTNSLYKQSSAIEEVSSHMHGFGQHIKMAFQSVASFATVTATFYGTISKVKEGITFVSDLNKETTSATMVSGIKNVKELSQSYNELAKQLGDTTLNVAKGSLEWLRQGKTIQETSELVKASTVASKLSGIETPEATTYLTAALNGFQLESNKAMEVLDKMVVLDSMAATSVSELSESLMHSASSANLAGVSMDKLLSWVTLVSSTTRKSASSIGESFNDGGLVA